MKDNNSDESIQEPEEAIEQEMNGPDEKPDVYASIQERFNELRSEYLDSRAKSINRWLGFISIVLIFFTLLIPIITGIAAYFVYDRFGDLQSQMVVHVKAAEQHASDAAKNASESAKYLKEIKEHQTKVKGVVAKLTSKDFTNPNKIAILESSIEDILDNPAISLEDKAIIEAYRLQKEGNLTDAIEKWRSIANTATGVNDELVARAFFSIGFLHTQLEEYDQAVSAYDQSIELLPTFADAYTNRGAVKSLLGNPEGAVADHSEAIRLNPNFVEAYINRGSAKRALGDMDGWKADMDKALDLAKVGE